MTDFTQIGSFISNVGFPIAVAVFVLYKLNGKLEGINDGLHKLTSAVEKLTWKIVDKDK